nr:hypothetical protein [uncultured Draconibacterium sp.]
MKKVMMIFVAGLIMMLANLNVNAQDEKDYFVGKWDILVEGTPSGDTHNALILKRGEDGNLTGTFQSEGKEPTKITRVEESANEVTVYFLASGYDVYLDMEKIDEDKMEGSMMDMFDCYATRVKEEK